ncbi:MAG: PPK2 family polyphosphate kinase [Thermoplasmata archaeon]
MNELMLGTHGPVRLRRYDAADTSAFHGSKRKASKESERLVAELDRLQELLYASHQHSLLIILQGLDTAGKDGTIRHVFEGVNPQGVRVAKFERPTPIESDHDFLWRVHAQVPGRGEIAIFNRSHYEDVLAARVDRTVARKVWERRYRAINEFEWMLSREGTTVLKFFLHVSRKEQGERLRERWKDPTKHWKLRRSDLVERKAWPRYTRAIEETLDRTNTSWAPWYLVPSDLRWFRDWAVVRTIVHTLRGFHLKWPPLAPGLKTSQLPR